MSSRGTFLAVAAAALGALGSACTDQTLPWQLDHDRIVAVRATPPHIAADGRAVLDVLVTSEAGEPSVVAPLTAAVVPPEPGMPVQIPVTAVPEYESWYVIAPDADTLSGIRAALGWPPDMPVPVRIAVTVEVAGQPLAAIKTVYLGSERANPRLGAVTIGAEPARDGAVLPTARDVSLEVMANDDQEVDWLTSFGELSDSTDTLATLYAEEPAEGHIAVVVRDGLGGVVWGQWQVQAAP